MRQAVHFYASSSPISLSGYLLKRVMMACTLLVSVILCLVGLKGFFEELMNLPDQSARP